MIPLLTLLLGASMAHAAPADTCKKMSNPALEAECLVYVRKSGASCRDALDEADCRTMKLFMSSPTTGSSCSRIDKSRKIWCVTLAARTKGNCSRLDSKIHRDCTYAVQALTELDAVIEAAMFPNTLAEDFSREVEEASAAAVATEYGAPLSAGPYVAGTAGFTAMVESGRKFKWVMTGRGLLVVIDPTLKHAVAAGGDSVWTAGMGSHSAGKITLDNETGHYRTTFESLQRAGSLWEKLGYTVDYEERKDFQGLFNGLGQ